MSLRQNIETVILKYEDEIFLTPWNFQTMIDRIMVAIENHAQEKDARAEAEDPEGARQRALPLQNCGGSTGLPTCEDSDRERSFNY
jgi:hypothetical protein